MTAIPPLLLPSLHDPALRTLVWVGLAKNGGKTTSFVAALHELHAHGPPEGAIGVLSSGVDGERNDAYSGAPKPRILIPTGTLVVTADRFIADAAGALAIVATTGMRSLLGEILVAEAQRPTEVVLAGLRRRSELLRARDLLFAQGATRVLVDGALDRRASADPVLADGIVLATGAVVAPDLAGVVDATRDVADRFRLPVAAAPPRSVDRVELALPDGPVLDVEAARAHAAPASIGDAIAHLRTRADGAPIRLYAPGLVADPQLLAWLPHAAPDLALVLRDPTRLLASASLVRRWRASGASLAVLASPRLVAVAANPHAPGGSALDSDALLDALARALPDVDIVDVARRARRPAREPQP